MTRPEDLTVLSERERTVVEQIAAQRGLTFDEAVEQMAKEGLAARVKKKTGRNPAKVYEIRRPR